MSNASLLRDRLLNSVINADVLFDPHTTCEVVRRDEALKTLDDIEAFLTDKIGDLEAIANRGYEIANLIEAKTDDLEWESMVYRKWAGILSGFLTSSQLEEAYCELKAVCIEDYEIELS